jgi:hypothetical protein
MPGTRDLANCMRIVLKCIIIKNSAADRSKIRYEPQSHNSVALFFRTTGGSSAGSGFKAKATTVAVTPRPLPL